MPTSPSRRRLEIPEEVYAELQREAGWLHIPVATLATLYIREGVQRAARHRTGRGRSALAAQIGAEGSPSPTLAVLQREALGDGDS